MEKCSIIRWGTRIATGEVFMRQEISNFEEILSAVCNVCGGQNLPAEDTLDKCKALAVLNLNDKENYTSKEELDALEKEKEGEWVKCSTLRGITIHLQLLDALRSENHKREEDILENLLAYLGNAYYYRMEDLEKLFGLAAQLYEFCLVDSGVNRKRVFGADRNEYVKLRIRNAKYLMRRGYTLEVEKGEVDLSKVSEQELVKWFDTEIANVGGMWFVRTLFQNEISVKYHKGLARYLIMRDKHVLGDRRKIKERVPYAYLLQLGMKHLENKNSLLTEQGKQEKYEEVLRAASAYLEILHLQGHNVMEDMFSGYEDFPMVLSCNMLYEKMCIPRQYHPEYVGLLVAKLVGPFYQEIPKNEQKFSLEDYVTVMRYVLGQENGPVIISEAELQQKLPLSSKRVHAILYEISIDSSEVNKDFCHFLDSTNTWQKPLVRLSGNRFFCLDARMAGYAFYEALYQLTYQNLGKLLNKRMGKKLEEVIYGIFEEKKIPFVKGKYKCIGELPERDCDMIIEGDKQLLFIEFKKIPLPESYENGDDVSVLEVLDKGMLYAQEQILWHRLRLHKYSALELEDDDKHIEIRENGRRIFPISLCMPEYDFLSDQMIVKNFMESTLFVSYHAHDPAREAALEQLNKRTERIKEISAKLFDGKSYSARDVFFDSSFMSLQQLWMALRFFPTKEKLLDYFSKSHCIVTGMEDVYGNMWQLRRV